MIWVHISYRLDNVEALRGATVFARATKEKRVFVFLERTLITDFKISNLQTSRDIGETSEKHLVYTNIKHI
jgi:hypothetical protein